MKHTNETHSGNKTVEGAHTDKTMHKYNRNDADAKREIKNKLKIRDTTGMKQKEIYEHGQIKLTGGTTHTDGRRKKQPTLTGNVYFAKRNRNGWEKMDFVLC